MHNLIHTHDIRTYVLYMCTMERCQFKGGPSHQQNTTVSTMSRPPLVRLHLLGLVSWFLAQSEACSPNPHTQHSPAVVKRLHVICYINTIIIIITIIYFSEHMYQEDLRQHVYIHNSFIRCGHYTLFLAYLFCHFLPVLCRTCVFLSLCATAGQWNVIIKCLWNTTVTLISNNDTLGDYFISHSNSSSATVSEQRADLLLARGRLLIFVLLLLCSHDYTPVHIHNTLCLTLKQALYDGILDRKGDLWAAWKA